MKRINSFDLKDLLLPLGNKIGAIQKVTSLIDEMQHPNTDWKYVVAGIRTYLYDNIYDIPPFSEKILPILFYYLKEATLRKKASAVRASDTFIDRLIFVLQNIEEEKKDYKKFKSLFLNFTRQYLDLLITESREGFYFDYVNNRIIQLTQVLRETGYGSKDIHEKLATFIALQFGIYIDLAIQLTDEDVNSFTDLLTNMPEKEEVTSLLNQVSR